MGKFNLKTRAGRRAAEIARKRAVSVDTTPAKTVFGFRQKPVPRRVRIQRDVLVVRVGFGRAVREIIQV